MRPLITAFAVALDTLGTLVTAVGRWWQKKAACPECRGTGEGRVIDYGVRMDSACPECYGSGTIDRSR